MGWGSWYQFEGFDISRHEAGIAKLLSEATKGDEKMRGKRHHPFLATLRRCVGPHVGITQQQSVRPLNCHPVRGSRAPEGCHRLKITSARSMPGEIKGKNRLYYNNTDWMRSSVRGHALEAWRPIQNGR